VGITYKMNLQSINKFLKIGILVLLILLLILVRIYKLDSCDLCQMEVENKKVSQPEFMNYYYDKCLSQYKVTLNYSYVLNLTQVT
jgi:hypothetical protein